MNRDGSHEKIFGSLPLSEVVERVKRLKLLLHTSELYSEHTWSFDTYLLDSRRVEETNDNTELTLLSSI